MRVKVIRTGRFLLYCVAVLVVIPWAIAEEIQLTTRGGTFSIPVQLNNTVTLNFVLDTGAADVAVPADVVSTLLRSGTLTERDFVGSATYVMADGSKIPSPRFVLREVRIGNHSVRDVLASASSARGQPLLGQTFLSKLPHWSVDYRRNVLLVSTDAPVSQTSASSPPPTAPMTSGPVFPESSRVRYGGFGAFAHNEITGKYGLTANEETQGRADEVALKTCGDESCKIVFRTAPRECGAIAVAESGNAWGAGKRPQSAGAELDAVQNCQKRTKVQCKVRSAECNK
jgi:hypothetical protein